MEGDMSVRKREWITQKGEQREAWIVDYVDAGGVRRLKTFERKKDADAWSDSTGVAVREGTHVADSASVTVAQAGKLWIKSAQDAGLERTTIEQYKQHLRLHIVGDDENVPEDERNVFIGHLKLSQLNAPTVRAFEDRLQAAGRSPTMVRYVVRSLGALLADAQERGMIIRNPVRELRGRRRRGGGRQERRNGKLKIGVDIPTREEIKAIVNAADGRWRPLLLTAVFTGLRASELRGLRWDDVDLKKAELHVRQRADRFNKIGQPKTHAGERSVPLPPMLVQELREWKLKCPKKDGKLGLVFPNGEGNVEFHVNIIERGFKPTILAAGVTVPVPDKHGTPKRDEDGKRIVEPKYTGLHSLRHFYASWSINRKADGGLELPAKVVQERMGHSSIVVTMDTYGHLFPRGDDGGELEAAEKALLG
jgi:integrase